VVCETLDPTIDEKTLLGVMAPAKAGVRALADAKSLGELIALQG